MQAAQAVVGMSGKHHDWVDSLGSSHFLIVRIQKDCSYHPNDARLSFSFSIFWFCCSLGIKDNVGAFSDNSVSTLSHLKSTSSFAFGSNHNSDGVGLSLHKLKHSAWMILSSSARVSFFSRGSRRRVCATYGYVLYRMLFTCFLQVEGIMNFRGNLPALV